MSAQRELTSTHWGVYEVVRDAHGAQLRGLPEDPDPSPIGLAMLEAYRSSLRVQRPAIRKSWLESGPGAAPERRGREPFVEVPWEVALQHVAAELQRVRDKFGNSAIFGGSYGWSSAGRFHHAQSQVHRFLNTLGGYVRHVDSYSLGAARVLMPHVLMPWDEMSANHHAWDVLAQHTRLMVCFGGVPRRNGQVAPGGNFEHRTRAGLAKLARAGCRIINLSPLRTDVEAEGVEWLPIRPHSDTAIMLALAHTAIAQNRHDAAFLQSHCVGFDAVRAYLFGEQDGIVKDVQWAAALSGVPAQRLERLARDLCDTRSLVNVAWSLQRSDHGEQPFWAALTLAAVVGQIGLPGGGFSVYGPIGTMGSPHHRFGGPVLPQGTNGVADFIPVARVADMLLDPGGSFDYNGKERRYPDIRLVYWAGGNPFHHHQDLNRLVRAWHKPETIVVHEQVWNAHARMADIVLPATTTTERPDIGFSTRDPLLVAMRPIDAPPGEARDDFAIFTDLAQRLGTAAAFTEGRSTRQWLQHMYEAAAPSAARTGAALPSFEAFWAQGEARLPANPAPPVLLEAFRADPIAHPLTTPSGKIELYSARIASFGYADCRGQATWYEPAEWLGAPLAQRFPLHLLSPQPEPRLHSQLDFSAHSRARKVGGREPVHLNPQDAAARGIADGDVVRLYNERGACLAGALLNEDVMPGVALMHTGAWYDPEDFGVPGALDKHGNVNVLTRDRGSSSLSQGCSAQTCLVQAERFDGVAPPVTAFAGPTFAR
jgi:biotin/methionine sulfoxide reductase